MDFTYHQALKIKYDYSELVGRESGYRITDLIIVPAEKEFFEDFMECYRATRNDLQCIKRFETNRFGLLVIQDSSGSGFAVPYQDLLDFVKKKGIPFDRKTYELE